jgi:phosphate-selective porin OprO and OprP
VPLLCLAPLAVIAAEPATLEDRVRALEIQLAKISGENAGLRKQLGLDGKSPPAVVTAGGKETKLSIGGYLQGHAEFGDAPDTRFAPGDRFLVRRARITVKGGFAVTDRAQLLNLGALSSSPAIIRSEPILFLGSIPGFLAFA